MVQAGRQAGRHGSPVVVETASEEGMQAFLDDPQGDGHQMGTGTPNPALPKLGTDSLCWECVLYQSLDGNHTPLRKVILSIFFIGEEPEVHIHVYVYLKTVDIKRRLPIDIVFCGLALFWVLGINQWTIQIKNSLLMWRLHYIYISMYVCIECMYVCICQITSTQDHTGS